MPRYRFEFHEYLKLQVVEIELPDAATARQEAIESTRESLLDGASDGLDTTAWLTMVYDEMGNLLTTVHFSDLMTANGEADPKHLQPPHAAALRAG